MRSTLLCLGRIGDVAARSQDGHEWVRCDVRHSSFAVKVR